MEHHPQGPLPPPPPPCTATARGVERNRGRGRATPIPLPRASPRSEAIAPFIILTLLLRTRGPRTRPSGIRGPCARAPGWESEGPARGRPAGAGRCGRSARCPESVSSNAPPGEGGEAARTPANDSKCQTQQRVTVSDGLFGAHSFNSVCSPQVIVRVFSAACMLDPFVVKFSVYNSMNSNGNFFLF